MINKTQAFDIHVGMCEVKIGLPQSSLKAILGSCVGIGFIVPSLNLRALAHCLLPTTTDGLTGLSAKFVVHAIPSLFKVLDLSPYDAPLIQAVVAGGASMQGESESKILRVGEANIRTAVELLGKYKVKIIHQETGSTFGRQMILEPDGTYRIRNLITTEIKTGT